MKDFAQQPYTRPRVLNSRMILILLVGTLFANSIIVHFMACEIE